MIMSHKPVYPYCTAYCILVQSRQSLVGACSSLCGLTQSPAILNWQIKPIDALMWETPKHCSPGISACTEQGLLRELTIYWCQMLWGKSRAILILLSYMTKCMSTWCSSMQGTPASQDCDCFGPGQCGHLIAWTCMNTIVHLKDHPDQNIEVWNPKMNTLTSSDRILYCTGRETEQHPISSV